VALDCLYEEKRGMVTLLLSALAAKLGKKIDCKGDAQKRRKWDGSDLSGEGNSITSKRQILTEVHVGCRFSVRGETGDCAPTGGALEGGDVNASVHKENEKGGSFSRMRLFCYGRVGSKIQ